MKIGCISDSHGLHDYLEIPECDMLIHAGDVSDTGKINQIEDFLDWFSNLPNIKYKIFVAGNHDFFFEAKDSIDQEMIDNMLSKYNNIIYLQDSFIEIEGLKIYGSPWQPWFYDWAFNIKEKYKLNEIWRKIPDDTNILITHTPAFGMLDRLQNGMAVGCDELTLRIKDLEKLGNLKLHVFGHIHESYGLVGTESIQFVNASQLNEQYRVKNKPIEIIL